MSKRNENPNNDNIVRIRLTPKGRRIGGQLCQLFDQVLPGWRDLSLPELFAKIDELEAAGVFQPSDEDV